MVIARGDDSASYAKGCPTHPRPPPHSPGIPPHHPTLPRTSVLIYIFFFEVVDKGTWKGFMPGMLKASTTSIWPARLVAPIWATAQQNGGSGTAAASVTLERSQCCESMCAGRERAGGQEQQGTDAAANTARSATALGGAHW